MIAARDAGVPVALVDHDLLARAGDEEDVSAAVARVPASDEAVYQGWMLRSEHYEASWAVASRFLELREDAFTGGLVLRKDNTWRVVELGDGQVSDRPSGLTPESLLAPWPDHRAAGMRAAEPVTLNWPSTGMSFGQARNEAAGDKVLVIKSLSPLIKLLKDHDGRLRAAQPRRAAAAEHHRPDRC